MTSIVVGKDRINLIESERYVAGTAAVYVMKISFSKDWEGLEKHVIFRTTDFDISLEVLRESEQFPIPSQIFARPTNKLQVGVYGSKCDEKVLNTAWLSLGRVVPGTHDTVCGCHIPSVPSTDTYKTLRMLIERKADRLTYENGQFILWSGSDPLSSFDAPNSLPSGGKYGQVLTKSSDVDGDVEWAEITGDLSLPILRDTVIFSLDTAPASTGTYIFQNVQLSVFSLDPSYPIVKFDRDIVYVDAATPGQITFILLNNTQYIAKVNEYNQIVDLVISTSSGSSSGGDSEGGTYDHRQLKNRDAIQQHPITSITNLTEQLAARPSRSMGTAAIDALFNT